MFGLWCLLKLQVRSIFSSIVYLIADFADTTADSANRDSSSSMHEFSQRCLGSRESPLSTREQLARAQLAGVGEMEPGSMVEQGEASGRTSALLVGLGILAVAALTATGVLSAGALSLPVLANGTIAANQVVVAAGRQLALSQLSLGRTLTCPRGAERRMRHPTPRAAGARRRRRGRGRGGAPRRGARLATPYRAHTFSIWVQARRKPFRGEPSARQAHRVQGVRRQPDLRARPCAPPVQGVRRQPDL